MKIFKILTLFAGTFGLFLTGCATHSLMRGSVVMKESDTRAHVCLGQNEVKVGDRLQLYKNVCTKSVSEIPKKNSESRKIEKQSCKRVDGGYGEVMEVLNDHYSVVSFPEGTSFAEGDTIEKGRNK